MVKSGIFKNWRVLHFEKGRASRYERCIRLFDFGKPLEVPLRKGGSHPVSKAFAAIYWNSTIGDSHL